MALSIDWIGGRRHDGAGLGFHLSRSVGVAGGAVRRLTQALDNLPVRGCGHIHCGFIFIAD